MGTGERAQGSDHEDLLLGQKVLELGLITQKQLTEALVEQARRAAMEGEPPSLGYVLVQRGLVPEQKLTEILWEGEVQKAGAEIRDLIDSVDRLGQAPAASETRRLPLVKEELGSGTPFGKYRLLREAGRGGMAVVYEAFDPTLNRKAAVKMLLPSSKLDPDEAKLDEERFHREAQLNAKMPPHPNVVQVYETGVVEGKRYIAMEYIIGREMVEWWRKSYASTRLQVRVLRDVALAVHHAHLHGVIHRDLKPNNILVDDQNRPHVTDFGLARTAKRGGDPALTSVDRVVGTPTYMSPEQAEGRRSLDKRSDVYSLGVVLYEILAGRPPFRGGSPVEIMVKVARDPVPPPSSIRKKGVRAVDRALEAICLKALQKNPADRYPTAKAFADELTRWLRGEGSKMADYRRFAAVGLAAGALAVLLAVLLTRGGDDPPPPPRPQPPPPRVLQPPSPPPAPLAERYEGESLRVRECKHGSATRQAAASFPKAERWSGGAQLFWTGGRPRSRLVLAVPGRTLGRRTLALALTKSKDYGIVRISLNGELVVEDLDLYAPTIDHTGEIRIAGVPVSAGDNELVIELVGTNPEASPFSATSELFQFGLDYVELR
jgi:serine/threonine protein kinase